MGLNMKTKSLEERLREIFTKIFGSSIYIESGRHYEIVKPLTDFIKSELDNRDKQWLEAVGEDEPDPGYINNMADERETRNQLRLEIKNLMGVK
jgi:hypothetical protein